MTSYTATAPIVKANDGRYGLRAPKGGCTVDGKVYRGGSFCPPYRIDNPHALPAVEIKGASYLVRPIPAGECGVSAVRLTKLASHESYDVIRHHDGLVACDCPSYIFTHEGKSTTCKHGMACMVHGLLPVAPILPAVVNDESPVLLSDDESVYPVTEEDHREWVGRQRGRRARFAPSAADQAEWATMAYRLEQEAEERANDARIDREYQERMEDAFGEHGHDWADSERIEAVGCIEARRN